MRQRKLLMFLAFITLLSGCKNGSSSIPQSSDSGTTIPTTTETSTEASSETSTSKGGWVEPEEVWVPNWDFDILEPYAGDYWDGLDLSLRGQELATAVREHIEQTFVGINYTQALSAIEEMDADPNRTGYSLTIYDLRSRPNGNFSIWNREHVFPQSKLADNDESLRAAATRINISSDIANLFACDDELNEIKSNKSLAEWNYESDKELYFDFLSRSGEGLLTDNILFRGYFSPSWQSRGETARSQLYMLMKYPQNCALTENFAIETMLDWDLNVPRYVQRDGQRQAGLMKYQSMRNPFIDIPELGCYIWGDENSRTRRVCSAILAE